jgi:hypothetical protein
MALRAWAHSPSYKKSVKRTVTLSYPQRRHHWHWPRGGIGGVSP